MTVFSTGGRSLDKAKLLETSTRKGGAGFDILVPQGCFIDIHVAQDDMLIRADDTLRGLFP